MIGLGIVSLFLVINASIRASLDHMVDDRFRGDVVIDAGTGYTGGGLSGTIAQDVGDLPEVDAASGIRVGFAEIDGDAVAVSGFNTATAFDLFAVNVTAGSADQLGPGEIGVFEGIADSKGWEVGDRVPVVFGDTGAQHFTVVALFDSKELTGAYVLDSATFDEHLPGVGDNQVWIRLSPGVTADDARHVLEPFVADFPSAEVLDLDEFKAMIKSQYDVILVLVNALMALTIVIAMIGIVNTLVLSVVERTREIALVRAVGASRGQIRASIRWEALLIATFGLAAALGIGVFFGWVLVRALADDGFSVFALPTTQLAVFTAVTAVLTRAGSGSGGSWVTATGSPTTRRSGSARPSCAGRVARRRGPRSPARGPAPGTASARSAAARSAAPSSIISVPCAAKRPASSRRSPARIRRPRTPLRQLPKPDPFPTAYQRRGSGRAFCVSDAVSPAFVSQIGMAI